MKKSVKRRFIDAARAALRANDISPGAPTLPDRAATYLATGDDHGVLAAITIEARRPGGSWSSSWPEPERQLRRTLYQMLDDVPPELGLRWARIVGAFGHWGLTLTPIAGEDWAEILVADLGKCFTYAALTDREALPCRYSTLDAIVVAGDGAPGELLLATFGHDSARPYAGNFYGARSIIRALPDYTDAVAAHATEIAAATAHVHGTARPTVVELLTPLPDVTLGPFAEVIADYLIGENTTLALQTEPLARRCPQPALATALQHRAETRPTAQQLRALRSLWSYCRDSQSRSWAVDFAATAVSAGARALAREWAEIPDPANVWASTPTTQPSTTPTRTDWHVPLTPELRAAIDRLRTDINAVIDARTTELRSSPYPRDRERADKLRPIDASVVDTLADLLTDARPPTALVASSGTSRASADGRMQLNPFAAKAFDRFAMVPDLTATAAITVHAYFDELRHPAGDRGLTYSMITTLNRIYKAHNTPDLLAVARLLDDLQLDGTAMVIEAYRQGTLARDWPAAAVAPFVAAHLHLFQSMLAEPPHWRAEYDSAVYRALGTLPELPDGVADSLYRVALGSTARHRREAQDALANDPRRTARLHAAVRDSAADTRIVAADWLGRSGTPADAEVLEAAYRAERADRVQQAQLDALAALGRPAQHYLNRDTLTAAAAKGSGTGSDRLVKWFDLATLPPVRWASDHSAKLPGAEPDFVDPEILGWVIRTAAKLKSPEPSVALRYYCALFDADDMERVGDQLLDAFLAGDGAPIAGKGVLAVCAVSCRDNAAPLAQRFLTTYYGQRVAHCRAAIVMLGWVDRPNSVALLLAVSQRFRTKSIQQEAVTQVAALAARKGWTTEELADRTVPDVGFGADGRLILHYGPRYFVARINDALKLVLSTEDGNLVKSLPAPRISDDAAAVTEAKRDLAAARKAVKTLIPQQVRRLQESMYAERSWALTEWTQYLYHHPLMAVLVRRLIWATLDESGAVLTTFRPLDDGTLTDVDDDDVTLDDPATARVTLIRPGLLSEETAAQWRAHLVDYQVEALFDQLGESYEMPAEQEFDQSVDTYRGHVIDAYDLRSVTTRLGYTRGPTGDGGIFGSYEKRFPALGFVASIGFSGSQLPEENLPVALTELSYRSLDDDTAVSLRDLPVLLLGAGIGDLKTIAERGDGFDADWRSKVAFH